MSLARLLSRASAIDAESEDALAADDEWSATVERVRAEIRSQLVPEQLALFSSTNRWDAACCARQCGKSFTAARMLVDTALGIDDSISVYVSDTLDNAVKVMWVDQDDGLPAVLDALGLVERRPGMPPNATWHYRVNLSTKAVTFRNGSVIELTGADRGAWTKFRGRKLNLVIADEMQRQHQESLERALRSDLPNCFNVRNGRFVGLGTVGRALKGTWFEVNAGTHGLCPVRPGWCSFHWTAYELRDLTPAYDRQMEEARAKGVDTEKDPEFLREDRGKWVRDEQGLLHALSEASLWDGDLPSAVRTRCPEHGVLRIHCVCDVPLVPRSQVPEVYAGLDLGAGTGEPGEGDPCGVVAVSVSREEGVQREVHSEERGGMDTAQMAAWLRGLMDTHGIRRFYCDPAWKLTVQDLRRLYGLPVEIATKGDAEGTTEDLWHGERQAALRTGMMRVLRGSTLHGQLESVLRDPAALEDGHLRQASGQRDHALDAWRYVFRMVRTRHVAAPEPPPTPEQEAADRVAEVKRAALTPRGERPGAGRPRSLGEAPKPLGRSRNPR